MQYGMIIDLQRCVGCTACAVACMVEQSSPPGIQFNRIIQYVWGKYPQAKPGFLPLACLHCREAPCIKVCPTTASRQTSAGVVIIESELCIGCRACMQACPYQSRSFIWREATHFTLPTEDSQVNLPESQAGLAVNSAASLNSVQAKQPIVTGHSMLTPYECRNQQAPGLVLKCNFCLHRLEQGLQPACVLTCPAKARIFGDFDDPNSEISQLAQQAVAFKRAAGTLPKVLYLEALAPLN